MPSCKKCQNEFEPKDLLEGLCVPCIYAIGSELKTFSKADVERIRRDKATIDTETSGLFLAPGLLRNVLEELLDDVENGEDRDLAVTKAENAIQRLGGIGMCQHMIKMADALADFARSVEEDARRRIGILSKLGREKE